MSDEAPPRRAPALLAAMVLVATQAACAEAASGTQPGPDLARVDLARPDLVEAPADLAEPEDLTPPPSPDLAWVGDLASSCKPVTQPCDLVCQNCGAGGRCAVVDKAGTLKCVAAGTVGIDQQCGKFGQDDCQAGALCILESSTQNLAFCRRFCRGDGDCVEGGRCVNRLADVPSVTFCSEPVTSCDPVKLTGCGGGMGCYPVTPAGLMGCHVVGTGGQGTTCSSDYDCKAGHGCAGPAANMLKCLRICRKGTNSDCPAGTTCFGVNGWTVNYGVCGT